MILHIIIHKYTEKVDCIFHLDYQSLKFITTQHQGEFVYWKLIKYVPEAQTKMMLTLMLI